MSGDTPRTPWPFAAVKLRQQQSRTPKQPRIPTGRRDARGKRADILRHLSGGTMTSAEIAAATGTRGHTATNHLKPLLEAALVSRHGSRGRPPVVYAITKAGRTALASYEAEKELTPRQRIEELERVLAQTYVVAGAMVDELGIFGTPRADKLLDNLSEMRLVHDDLIPWPSAGEIQKEKH